MELEILYHGTKFKYIANKILKEGFNEYSYFATDLNTAIIQGGKYVFEVFFLASDLPDYWQVRCENKIPSARIIKMSRHKEIKMILNKNLKNKIFNHSLEFDTYKQYCFKESDDLNKIIKKLRL